ncbi:SAM-dependent methyltransferase [Kribbella sp. NPDC056345]|uniref:SAM-dependent methyltransferase n=1 Tax=Kribbella sp. NPDC056345 TaxID=3345789 RepID=UPI0035DEC2ED
MSNQDDQLARFALAGQARDVVKAWVDGAQVLSLVTALRDKGWMTYLAEPRTLDALTAFSGLTPERVADLVTALEAHGVVQQNDGAVQLTDSFAALAADDAYIGLDDALDQAELLTRMMRTAVEDPGPLPLSEPDALVTARATGGKATPVTAALYDKLFLPQIPELAELIHTDRFLDVGCGVAGATTTLAGLFPDLRGTAIELIPTVAAETRRRIDALGVSDRVDLKVMDAREFDEKDVFGSAFWAQPFFPAETRQATLEMILRALRPGGILFVQEMEPLPDEAGRPSYTLRKLVAQGWGVPFGRTAEELADEAVAVGFELIRIAQTDFGRMVLVGRPI